ncbi:MAG: hypothetical protein AB7V13_09340 [Pseudorhodoplanes sp.]|uniref:hypothetical protein n=1 Tax=Pseudorhodoplanes sp. TaxID=1934341 RepID=UPI003D0A9B5B
MRVVTIAVLLALAPGPACAANCSRSGSMVTCDDGRTGILAGDAIIWPDGTRSSNVRHPSVSIGHKDSVRVGPGVFVGAPSGRGSVPLDDPNAPHKRDCAVLDGVPYCH